MQTGAANSCLAFSVAPRGLLFVATIIPSLIRINLTTELLARASSLNGVRKFSEDLLEDISVLSLL